MIDPTENIRRQLLAEMKSDAATREELAAKHGNVWSTHDLGKDFEVLGFMAPFVVVRRRTDGTKGSLEFQHSPRFYFNFVADH